jgi:hypothetical protein
MKNRGLLPHRARLYHDRSVSRAPHAVTRRPRAVRSAHPHE